MSAVTDLTWVVLPDDAGAPRTLHLNTSANGGGVAEILTAVTTYSEVNGLAHGWGVLGAGSDFYDFTKNLHHLLHGHGDPGMLSVPPEGDVYRRTLERVLPRLLSEVRPTDTIVLHDPQTLGLARGLRDHVAGLYWHCHVGSAIDSRHVKEAVWSYFGDDAAVLDGVVVADRSYVQGITAESIVEISPAIWSLSPKNRALSSFETRRTLAETGLFGSAGVSPDVGRLWQTSPVPEDAVVVLQVSRWDPLKGMSGVLRALSRFGGDAHLILAGPDPHEILDDPEGADQLAQTLRLFEALPADVRRRAHIVAFSSHDAGLNALRINALQRRADIVVQRSVEEGFGLTVTEAMLKGRPVVASRTGGLPKQIDSGRNGLLVDPIDEDELVEAVNALVLDPRLRADLGLAAASDSARRFSLDRLVEDYRSLTATTTKQGAR